MKKLLGIIFFLIVYFGINAQKKDDIDFLVNSLNKEIIKVKNEGITKLGLDFSGYIPFMFSFYKDFLSSQDFNNCIYYPSCSSYAIHAIEKKGLFVGSIMTFDRLMRCNPSSVKFYEYDIKINKLKDTIE
jgi:putative membrane protein insertion efficiency factor